MQLIITHTDADGWVSAYLVNEYVKLKFPHEDIYNFVWNYGQDYSNIEHYLTNYTYSTPIHIWMTDITLPDEFMEKYAKYIHHFDHHASRLEKPASWTEKLLDNQSAISIDNYNDLSGNQAKQISACELVWKKLMDPDNTKLMPNIVRYVGRYDVWDNNDDTFAIHQFIERFPVIHTEFKTKPYLDDFFKSLFTLDGFNHALKVGRDYLYYSSLFNAEKSSSISKVITLDNKKIIVGNPGRVNSSFYDNVVKQNPDVDGILTFYYEPNDNNWKISCYSVKPNFAALGFLTNFVNTINVLSIGGHINACGCVIDNDNISEFMKLLSEK